MKRFWTLTLTALLILSLSACKAKEEIPPAQSGGPAASTQTPEKAPGKPAELINLASVSSDAEKTEADLLFPSFSLFLLIRIQDV